MALETGTSFIPQDAANEKSPAILMAGLFAL